jgi:RHS repeat-associated protein
MRRLLALILLFFCPVAAGADPLIADAAHPLTGALGLEVRTGVSSPLIGVSADFDDLTWNTVTGGVETRNYVYNSMNQLTGISGSETTSFNYDNHGNLIHRTKDGSITDYVYDLLNRQTSMTLNATTQNAEQTLYSYYGPTWMRKTVQVGNGPATNYLHDGFACVSQTTNNVTTNYFVPGTTPLWEKTNNQVLAYAQDGRGNITGLWNGNNYAAKFNYDAFGNVKTTDAANNPLANTSGPRYGGQFHDANTDQIYLRNRYYDPKIGAFNRIDPIGFNGGLNLYGYCGGDGVNRSDAMGLDWEWDDVLKDWKEVAPFTKVSRPTYKGSVGDRVIGEIYYIENAITGDKYQGSAKDLAERLSNERHPARKLFMDDKLKSATTVTAEYVLAEPDVSGSGKNTERSAKNEALRAAEEVGIRTNKTLMTDGEGGLNKRHAATALNEQKWTGLHKVRLSGQKRNVFGGGKFLMAIQGLEIFTSLISGRAAESEVSPNVYASPRGIEWGTQVLSVFRVGGDLEQVVIVRDENKVWWQVNPITEKGYIIDEAALNMYKKMNEERSKKNGDMFKYYDPIEKEFKWGKANNGRVEDMSVFDKSVKS